MVCYGISSLQKNKFNFKRNATTNLVELQYGELDLLLLVFDLLGSGVVLLLALLSATPQPEDQVEGRLFLNIVVGKGTSIFQLLAGEDQALLIGGNA